jgi:hypothetical protein
MTHVGRTTDEEGVHGVCAHHRVRLRRRPRHSDYDALGARLFDLGQSEGAIHHSAGFDENGVFRIYEIWESLDHRRRFVQQTLQPLLAHGPADPSHPYRPDREYGYDLYALFQ